MKTKSFGNISALVLIGGLVGALFALDAWMGSGNFSLFQFPNGSIQTQSPQQNPNSNSERNKSPNTKPQTPKPNYQPKHIETLKYTNTQTQAETSFDVRIVDVSSENLSFFLKDEKGANIHSIHELDLQLQQEEKKLVFATNGGMFTPNHQPVGLYIENGKVIAPINLKQQENGNFYMQPNGVFGISKKGTTHIFRSKNFNEKWEKELKNATQSGPMLLIEGKIHPKFGKQSPNKRIRSGVGVMDSTTVVFAISNEPVNFYDFASFFRQKLGCRNALYLDGVISEMYLPKLGRYDSTGKFGVMIGIEELAKREL